MLRLLEMEQCLPTHCAQLYEPATHFLFPEKQYMDVHGTPGGVCTVCKVHTQFV